MLRSRPLVAVSLTPHIKNVEAFLAHCHRRRYPAKSTIIYAGDKSDSLYYIVRGSVTVLIEDDEGKEMIVAYLNDGDFFGEMGLFDKEDSRSAWIRRSEEHTSELQSRGHLVCRLLLEKRN